MDERLEQLVAEFVERRESGEDLSPQAFAESHPAHRDRLLKVLDSLHRVEDMFPDDTPGTPIAIGDWQVVRELGRGGLGRVFEVVRHDGGPARALKLLHTSAALDPRQGERFRREAAILRDFDHPGAVRVHEVGEDGGCPFLVMDLVEGRSLAAVIQAARERRATATIERRAALADRLELPGPGDGAARAARLLAAVARTVAAAHRRGLVHRDLKPSNVLLRADGTPAVIDFGLARDAGADTLTSTGDVLGTPHFMAPEQAAGQRGDHRVDVYGLGAILYELLTLQVPHPGSEPFAVLQLLVRHPGREPFAVLQAARSAPPRPPRALDPRIPKALESIVRRAMAHRPERRFADAERLAAALEAFAEGRRGTSNLSLGHRLEDQWRWHRRKIAALAAAILVATAIWAILAARGAGRARRAGELLAQAAAARLQDDPSAERLAVEALELADSPAARYLGGAALGNAALGNALSAGDAATAAGDPERAMAAYHEAREAAEEHRAMSATMAGLLAGLEGLAAAAAGQDEIAVRELTVAARAFPRVQRLQRTLADLHEAAGRHADAAVAFEAVGALAETDPEPWHRAAVNRMKARTPADRGEALRDIERALELAGDPAPESFLRTLAAAIDADQPEESIRILSNLIERFPHSASLHHNLGYVLHKEHRLAEAAQQYEEALRQDPQWETSLAGLAWIHGGLDDTCEQCKASLDAHPELLDHDRAERYMLRMIAVGGGQRRSGVETMVQVAQHIGRKAELARAIRGWLDRPDLDERHLGRLAKALQKLK